jgi:membrane protein required for colicin V production
MIQFYDIVMLVVLAVAVIFGVWKGVAWQVAALASVFVSAAVAIHSSSSISGLFPYEEPWNRYIAMLVLYVVTAGGIWLLFRLISNIIDRVKLKEFDRQLGAMFGLAKGVLYCVLITFFAVTLSEPARQMVLVSRSGTLIARGIRNANPILPQDIRTHLGKYIDELDERLHAPPVQTTQGEALSAAGTSAVPVSTPPSTLPAPAAAQTPSPKPETKKTLKDLLPKLK